MSKKSIKGHILKDTELQGLTQEFAVRLLHSLMMYHPVKLIGQDQLEAIPNTENFCSRETGAPFFTISSEPKTIDRFNSIDEVKKILTATCDEVLVYILRQWYMKHGQSSIYILNGPAVSFKKDGEKLVLFVGLHLAGATLMSQADNHEIFLKKENAKKAMPVVSQP